MDDLIQITRVNEHILQLTLNRPQQLNALNQALLAQLNDILHQVEQDETIRGLLITGSGKGFCAGADINELAALDADSGFAFAKKGQAIFNRLSALNVPTLAAIHGFAFGGGCELAMAATFRMAAKESWLGQPEIKLGVIPGFGGTQRLTHLVGASRALDLCLTGRRLDVEEAKAWGLINEITSHNDLLPKSIALLTEITSFSDRAIQSILSVIREGAALPVSAGLALEASHFGLCCASADKAEGVSAFLNKRQPNFVRNRHASK